MQAWLLEWSWHCNTGKTQAEIPSQTLLSLIPHCDRFFITISANFKNTIPPSVSSWWCSHATSRKSHSVAWSNFKKKWNKKFLDSKSPHLPKVIGTKQSMTCLRKTLRTTTHTQLHGLARTYMHAHNWIHPCNL